MATVKGTDGKTYTLGTSAYTNYLLGTQPGVAATTGPVTVTQGQRSSDGSGINNFDPNTGQRLSAGQSVTINPVSKSGPTWYGPGATPTTNYTAAGDIGVKAANVSPPPPPTSTTGIVEGNNTALAGYSANTVNPFSMVDGKFNLTPPAPTGDKVQDASNMSLYNLAAQAVGLQQQNQPANNEQIFQNTYGVNGKEALANSNQATADVNKYTSDLNGIIQSGETAKNALIGQARGIPMDILNNQADAITRRVAIEALPVQAQLAIAQGSLDRATKILDQLYQVRTKDAENTFAWKNSIIDTVMQYATKAEERKFNRLKELEARDNDTNKDFLAAQNQFLLSAVTQKAPSSVVDAINKATTMAEAVQAAGEYGGDILARQADELSLENTRSLIADRNRPTGGSSGGGSGGYKVASNAPKLTSTQLNNASSLLGLAPEEYRQMDGQLQLFFTTEGGRNFITDLNDMLAGSDEVSYNEILSGIDRIKQPEVVKDKMIQLLDAYAADLPKEEPAPAEPEDDRNWFQRLIDRF